MPCYLKKDIDDLVERFNRAHSGDFQLVSHWRYGKKRDVLLQMSGYNRNNKIVNITQLLAIEDYRQGYTQRGRLIEAIEVMKEGFAL